MQHVPRGCSPSLPHRLTPALTTAQRSYSESYPWLVVFIPPSSLFRREELYPERICLGDRLGTLLSSRPLLVGYERAASLRSGGGGTTDVKDFSKSQLTVDPSSSDSLLRAFFLPFLRPSRPPSPPPHLSPRASLRTPPPLPIARSPSRSSPSLAPPLPVLASRDMQPVHKPHSHILPWNILRRSCFDVLTHHSPKLCPSRFHPNLLHACLKLRNAHVKAYHLPPDTSSLCPPLPSTSSPHRTLPSHPTSLWIAI
ncbi:hypothetical protein C8F01DRAFT_1252693 [Mycena amicta]|nr:hypothetical protein C8F01DRAFT_1302546 [Mycena amicta]KAJ7061066.1 hypothetical protein C8F01DRAFT_1252693 [Mycena amicta]